MQLEKKKKKKINASYFKNVKIGIIISEWNSEITKKLYDGAKKTLIDFGYNDIITEYVPGSFELPIASQIILEKNSLDAVICLGCVIKGETKHFDFICNTTANGIKDVSLKYNIPVIFGVLTDNNIQQSIERSGGKYGNKGVEAAISAIKMISILKK
tara:strand:+ start:1368 stop:1838 length:471 start_codon:yes stop_codon:yes gene_type:complete